MASQAERSIYEVSLKPCDRRDASQRFNIGPCSTDGHIELRSGFSQALVKPGDHSPSPFCPVAHVEGRRMTCLDLNGEKHQSRHAHYWIPLQWAVEPAPGVRYGCSRPAGAGLGLHQRAVSAPSHRDIYASTRRRRRTRRRRLQLVVGRSRRSGAASQQFRVEPVSDSALYE